jgi:hypothetical protein
VIRFMLYHHADDWPVKRRERAISISIFVLMAGIAYGQLLHLTAPITIASWMIFIGVVGTVYSVYIVWHDERTLPEVKAIVELDDVEAHRHRPTKGGN